VESIYWAISEKVLIGFFGFIFAHPRGCFADVASMPELTGQTSSRGAQTAVFSGQMGTV
jgi:hypothetical protein